MKRKCVFWFTDIKKNHLPQARMTHLPRNLSSHFILEMKIVSTNPASLQQWSSIKNYSVLWFISHHLPPLSGRYQTLAQVCAMPTHMRICASVCVRNWNQHVSQTHTTSHSNKIKQTKTYKKNKLKHLPHTRQLDTITVQQSPHLPTHHRCQLNTLYIPNITSVHKKHRYSKHH